MKLYSCLHQLIFHSFKFNIFNPLCWHSMSDTLTSYSSPFLFHSSLKYFEGGFGKEIPNAILNGTSWDCKIPLTNIFLLLAFLYFMIFSLLSSNLFSFMLLDLFLFLLSKISGCRKTRITPRQDRLSLKFCKLNRIKSTFDIETLWRWPCNYDLFGSFSPTAFWVNKKKFVLTKIKKLNSLE